MKRILCALLMSIACVAYAQEDNKRGLLTNGLTWIKYTPLFGILGTDYASGTLMPPNFTEIGYAKKLSSAMNLNVGILAGKMTSGDRISIVKHEMTYVGIKLGMGFRMAHNERNQSFSHIALCIVPTSQKATVTFPDYYGWSSYLESMQANKTYFYAEAGYTFLINLNKAKNFQALIDASLQIVPDSKTPFHQNEALEHYDIIVPGAGSFPVFNPSLSFGLSHSF